jgi:hypothetical protein
MYDTAQSYRVLHNIVERLSQRKLKILNGYHIKKLRKRKKLNKTCRYIHDLSLY